MIRHPAGGAEGHGDAGDGPAQGAHHVTGTGGVQKNRVGVRQQPQKGVDDRTGVKDHPQKKGRFAQYLQRVLGLHIQHYAKVTEQLEHQHNEQQPHPKAHDDLLVVRRRWKIVLEGIQVKAQRPKEGVGGGIQQVQGQTKEIAYHAG